ncbi:hypothetical protein [Bacillus albus]|uniref:hypothetical protein n=1 Tax=Bacillus albus TaxID=2026189 RepID=UPI0013EC1506|nr:hypothetical protein [Bacillus albus]
MKGITKQGLIKIIQDNWRDDQVILEDDWKFKQVWKQFGENYFIENNQWTHFPKEESK